MYLSKSDFLKYQVCPSYFWLWKHKRAVVPTDEEEDIKRRLEQGNEVERYARQLFPGATLIESSGAKAKADTEAAIREGAARLFQATVITEQGLLAMADIIERNPDTNSWTLYEVKSTNSIKREHIYDVTFQRLAFEAAGYIIDHVAIIHLNKDYVRTAVIEPEDFLITSNVDAQVDDAYDTIQAQVNDALAKMHDTTVPRGCTCRLKTHGQHCPTFRYLNPSIPEYSVYNISLIGKKNLGLLVDNDIFEVHEVPEDIKLSIKQRNQVNVAKAGRPQLNLSEIRQSLGSLKFPLYFLDYETVSTAVPLYPGCTPYQQVPFQYSLHVLRAPEAELEHYEYLSRAVADGPGERLLAALSRQIGEEGSVVVWYQAFESARNSEMARAYPAYANFLKSLNHRIYDLMDVFSQQHFVHPEFQGSKSIKKVLPVLVPELSYKEMDIQNGQNASVRWLDAVTGAIDASEADRVYEALLKYCCLDTLAMVEIYRELRRRVR